MKRLLLLALLAGTPASLIAASGAPVIDGYLEPAGYVQLTSISSATALSSIPTGVKLTLIQAESQAVRWRDDGSNPTASAGMVIAAGDTLVYNGNPSALKVIETTASAKVNVSYYR